MTAVDGTAVLCTTHGCLAISTVSFEVSAVTAPAAKTRTLRHSHQVTVLTHLAWAAGQTGLRTTGTLVSRRSLLGLRGHMV